MTTAPSAVAWPATLLVMLSACVPTVGDKVEDLPMSLRSREALGRLRFARLHEGDRVERGDLVVCGEGDSVTLGFSRQLVAKYLGRDSDWVMPELFSRQSGKEVLLDVPANQVMRLTLPRGIGTEAQHPTAWVRTVQGTPLWSADMRTLERLFVDDDLEELFALRDQAAPPVGTTQSQRQGKPWRLGVSVLPRMGPRPGVVIANVIESSPAERAGLAKGDRILSVNERSLRTFRDLKAAIQDAKGPLLIVEIIEKGKKTSARVSIKID